MLFNTLNQAVELGWDFYLPVIIFVVLAALAVPVWASIGVAAFTMLLCRAIYLWHWLAKACLMASMLLL